MAYDFQVAVDSAEPHRMAHWWAQALGWTVEPSDEAFIKRMVADGHASEADTTHYEGQLVWRVGAAIVPPGDPEQGPYRRILFQLVPEAKTVKNRMHLDIRVGADQVEAESARLIEAGATFLHNGRQGPHTWVTLADPEGNEFCVS